MSYNGSGTFLINSAGQPVVANTVISATVFNALTSDLATGLSTAITKDGQTTITNNIPFGSNKITGLGSGTAAADAANLGQVQSTVAKLITVTGTDTITGSMSPQLTAYAAGQLFYFVANAANTGAVTLNIDSLGAKSITRDGSSALAAGDINSGEVVVVIYDGTRFQMINAANSFGNTTINGTLTVTGNAGFQANVSITSALSVGGVFAVTGAATFTANPTLSGGTANGVLYLNGSKVATSGSALYFDGTNLGVGTTTPSGKVQITGASASRYLTLNAPTDGGYITFEAGGTAFADAGSEKGLLGSGSATNFILAARSTNNILFATNNAERMRIDGSSGNVGIGTTPSGYLANKVVISTGTDSNNGITIASATNRNGSIWFADGTTGDQAYRGGVDYQHTTDTLYLYSGGQGNLQLNSSGNLGLGVTPSAWSTLTAFQVKNAAIAGYLNNLYAYANTYFDGTNVRYIASDFATQYRQTGGQHQFYTAPSGTAGNAITFTQAATLDANGTWLLGTTTAPAGATSANKYSVVKGSTEGVLVFGKANTGGGAITGNAGAGILFYTYTGTDGSETYSERGRFTAGGYFKASNSGTYVNSTGSYHEFRSDIDGAVLVVYNPNTGANVTNIYSELPSGANAGAYHFGAVVSGSGYQFTVDKDGDVKNTNNSYGSISDIKLKKDIVNAESQWEDIKNLRVRKYRFKNKPDEALQIGVIAQELEQVSPGLVEESVDRDKDGNDLGTTTKSVKYSVLYMKSVKALQEAMARIEQLEAKVAALEA